MDAFLLALMLTLVLDQGSGSQRLAARFAGAGPSDWAALGLGVLANSALAAALGAAIAALLVPEARLLFLAIALALSGGGMIAGAIRPGSEDKAAAQGRWRTAGRFTIRRAGENAAFATAGVAALTAAPILTAGGALLGGWVALLLPLSLGQKATRHGAMRAFQASAGIVLLCAAIACAASALRLL